MAKILAVHDGAFHADELVGTAILKRVFPLKIIRTRDAHRLAAADIRLDVGGKCDPSTLDFDHHQPEGAGKRMNGVPYAGCGLVWRHFGEQICGDKNAAEIVDELLIQSIDAEDIGTAEWRRRTEESLMPYTVTQVLEGMNPSWLDPEPDPDEAFSRALEFAEDILHRAILQGHAIARSSKIVENSIETSSDPRILILTHECPWEYAVARDYPGVVYAVVPREFGQKWEVRAVRSVPRSFELRKPLPAEWAGLKGEEFAQTCGVSDVVFCNTMRFVAVVKSLDGAVKLAFRALRL